MKGGNRLIRYKLKKNPKVKTIGELVKELRESQGMSVYRLSKLSKIPYSTLTSMESSGKKATFECVEKVSKALDVPLETFSFERRKIDAKTTRENNISSCICT